MTNSSCITYNEDFIAGFKYALSLLNWYNASEAGQCWQCFNAKQGLQHTNGPCRCTKEFRQSIYFNLLRKAKENV